ncbi:hypothetical protein MY04_2351 [Flammeovirga sp. MY04]|uniref:hypothetical protein n=1 Tax=Flammeovirga sp. MY04 TaxID=1191459 RepID=UPI0008060F81|nr:hypothetical protein [Flammeovirga sp. MY04]ANQ49723.1 hypothetical protein MY04_2351 [Flammeovirga sp. MY04]
MKFSKINWVGMAKKDKGSTYPALEEIINSYTVGINDKADSSDKEVEFLFEVPERKVLECRVALGKHLIFSEPFDSAPDPLAEDEWMISVKVSFLK